VHQSATNAVQTVPLDGNVEVRDVTETEVDNALDAVLAHEVLE
jgi:hypothetical protein